MRTRYFFGVDPGPTRSAIVLYDPTLHCVRMERSGIYDNAELLTASLWRHETTCAIEIITGYGMGVGQEVFDTCIFIGRLAQKWDMERVRHPDRPFPPPAVLIPRKDIKLALCHTSRAKDANVRAALLDIFGPGKAAAVGIKGSPGPLYGVKSHLWAALGVAVVAAGKADYRPAGAAQAAEEKT